MKKPQITVLMPVYNGEKYLAESIKSILEQTEKNFIFLIINDGSTDDSGKIIREFTDPRIVILDNNENCGLVYSLNRGIDFADTKYIARMDADDLARPERLERQLSFMDTNFDVGICGSYVRYFGNHSDGNVFKMALHSEEIKAELIFSSPYSHPSVIMRKEFLDKYHLHYDENYKNIEDFDLFQRASRLFKMANIPEILLDYRKVETSISSTITKNKVTNEDNHKRIYKQGLDDFGIIYNSLELDVHKNIIFAPSKKELTELIKVELWLLRLLSHNNERHYFEENTFCAIVGQYWDRVCTRSSHHLGLKGFFVYFRSNLFTYSRMGSLKIVKFFIKSIFHPIYTQLTLRKYNEN
jgi:glycosyltransferase involved in cell wall biosynthesis